MLYCCSQVCCTRCFYEYSSSLNTECNSLQNMCGYIKSQLHASKPTHKHNDRISAKHRLFKIGVYNSKFEDNHMIIKSIILIDVSFTTQQNHTCGTRGLKYLLESSGSATSRRPAASTSAECLISCTPRRTA